MDISLTSSIWRLCFVAIYDVGAAVTACESDIELGVKNIVHLSDYFLDPDEDPQQNPNIDIETTSFEDGIVVERTTYVEGEQVSGEVISTFDSTSGNGQTELQDDEGTTSVDWRWW